MSFMKIRTTMTQNGVAQPLKCIVFEGGQEGPSVTIEGGPFSGERYTPGDLANLVIELYQLRTRMQEVANGATI